MKSTKRCRPAAAAMAAITLGAGATAVDAQSCRSRATALELAQTAISAWLNRAEYASVCLSSIAMRNVFLDKIALLNDCPQGAETEAAEAAYRAQAAAHTANALAICSGPGIDPERRYTTEQVLELVRGERALDEGTPTPPPPRPAAPPDPAPEAIPIADEPRASCGYRDCAIE